MTTKPYIVLNHEDNDEYCDYGNVVVKFPDIDGSVLWHLTPSEARDTRKAFNDYHSPLHDHGYILVEVVEPIQESRDMVRNAIISIKEREDKERADRKRAEDQRLAAIEKRRVAAAEKKLQKETETKEQLYLRLKAEFEGEDK